MSGNLLEGPLPLEPIRSPATARDRTVRILERRQELTSVFQPICSVRHDVVAGYEALLRLPAELGVSGPEEAFALALGTDLFVELELAALKTHLVSAAPLREALLFLNLSASSFLKEGAASAEISRLIRAAGFRPDRIVFELTEIVRIKEPEAFARLLAPLRNEGFLFAIDDFGAGYSNLHLLVELGPDFLKLDRSLVTGASAHPRRRLFLESIEALSRRIGCTVIAEGIETAEDLEVVRACGIPLGQGYFIARPAPLGAFDGHRIDTVSARQLFTREEVRIGSLAVPEEGTIPEATVASLVSRFDARPALAAVPVLSGGRPIGLLTRRTLLSELSHQFGFSVWRDRSVFQLVSERSGGHDVLTASATLERASEVVARRPAGRRFDPLVVTTESGDYHGLLPVDLLLGEMTRLKLEYAFQSNPLTGLPGTLILERTVESLLLKGQSFALGWADLDDFKPFNDRYGFGRGDQVLLLAAEVLRRHFMNAEGDLLVNPGGDDFAFVLSSEGAEERAWAAAGEFSAAVRSLYDPADREGGGITSVDRQGVSRGFGFMTISFGLVSWRGEPGLGYHRLVELAAEVKGVAKKDEGSSVVVNRRALV